MLSIAEVISNAVTLSIVPADFESMTLKLQLLLADRCATCLATERVWRRVSAEQGVALEVVLAHTAEGRDLASETHLQMFPALLADRRVCAVGSPDEAVARTTLERLVRGQPPR